MTRLFAIIADPVTQVKSPALFNDRFNARGIDAVMLPMQVSAEGLVAVLAGLWEVANVHGIIVSIPHKFAAATQCRQILRHGKVANAVNVLRRGPAGWQGDLLDGLGFVHGLQRAGFCPSGRQCAVVGAGGAGTAIASALLAAGAGKVTVRDIDPGRQEALHDLLDRIHPGRVAIGIPDGDSDLAVNATPLGMNAVDPVPFAVGALPDRALVAEVIMSPVRTTLLDAAAERGLRTAEGRLMLEGQFEAMWTFFDL